MVLKMLALATCALMVLVAEALVGTAAGDFLGGALTTKSTPSVAGNTRALFSGVELFKVGDLAAAAESDSALRRKLLQSGVRRPRINRFVRQAFVVHRDDDDDDHDDDDDSHDTHIYGRKHGRRFYRRGSLRRRARRRGFRRGFRRGLYRLPSGGFYYGRVYSPVA